MSKLDVGVIDLFSGAGGLSLGFKQAGFEIICGVEANSYASNTFSKNFPEAKVINRDISSVTSDEIAEIARNRGAKKLIIIGGPPCQPYSRANLQNSGTEHPMASGVAQFGRIVRELHPSAFLFENVSSLRYLSGWDKFLIDFMRSGYELSIAGIRASNFGVPQSRYRLFVAGCLKGASIDLPSIRVSNDTPVVKDAIWDLTEIEAHTGGDHVVSHPRSAISKYSLKMMKKSRKLYNHWCVKHTDEVLQTIKHITQGNSLKSSWSSLPKKIKNRYSNYASLHANTYKRLSWREVASTIVSVQRAMILHPSLDRVISVREAARLQSFPDSFVFYGGITKQYQQVADAVPPMISHMLAQELRKVLVN